MGSDIIKRLFVLAALLVYAAALVLKRPVPEVDVTPPACPVEHSSSLTVTVVDPFIVYGVGAALTWEFYGFHGHFERGLALTAWQAAYSEAEARLRAGYGSQTLGTQTRTWSAITHDGETVDVVLIPKEQMTWRTLQEADRGVILLLCNVEKEFRLLVLADGVERETGLGDATMRRARASRQRLTARGVGSSNLALPTYSAARVSGLRTMNLPDPYVYHDAGMTTTWEYFGYYRQLDEAACQAAWVRMLEDTREQVVSGHGNVPVGTEARHWSGRSGDDDWVDLVVIPREAMTWRMLLEGFVGGIIVCAHVAKGYQFGVIAEGVEGEVAVGQVTTRVSRVVTA